jgi:hypothetical protein
MGNVISETYDREYSLLESIKYSNVRRPEIESSSLISTFDKLFFDILKPQLTDDDKKELFNQIEEFCIDNIRLEYKRTTHLDPMEFFVWHLSIFMVIQSFIKILESKYNLEHEKEIKDIFSKLLREDFYKFIELNSKDVDVNNVETKLRGMIKDFRKFNVLITPPKSIEMKLPENENIGINSFILGKYKLQSKYVKEKS